MRILRKMDLAVICLFVILAVTLVLIFIFAAAGARGAFAAIFVEGAEVLLIDLAQNEGESFEILSPNGMN